MHLWITGIIKECIKLLTNIQLKFAEKLSVDGNYEDSMLYLNSVNPYHDIVVETKNNINKKYDLHIIMPAYNVENYIKKSIDSVISQKTKYSYALTIVNDGSTDKTVQILNQYDEWNNIKIINQKNGGAASARNRALENINGKYIMFLDPDDYLCENAIEKLLDKAFLLNADIVEGSAYSLYKDKYLVGNRMHKNSGNKNENNLRGEPWGKVIRADIFERIKFPEKYYFEDTIFAYCIYPKLDRKYTISDCVYVYRINPGGTSLRSKSEVKAIDTYYIMGYMWNKYGNEMSGLVDFQERTLRHMVLCFKRTKRLGNKVTKAGFIYLSDIYINIFKDGNCLDNKYKKMDECIRNKSYKSYKLLCRRWRFLT